MNQVKAKSRAKKRTAQPAASGGEPVAEPTEELPWQRNRRLRLEAIEAAQAHGAQLAARYGDGASHRPMYAVVAYQPFKRRPRRR